MKPVEQKKCPCCKSTEKLVNPIKIVDVKTRGLLIDTTLSVLVLCSDCQVLYMYGDEIN